MSAPMDDWRMFTDEEWALLKLGDFLPCEFAKCNLGVGCGEAGVCYARANGKPEMCGMPNDWPPQSDAPPAGNQQEDGNE